MRSIKKILIIHTDGNTYNNPSLKCIINLLSENKIEVDIRYPLTFAPMPEEKGVFLIRWGRIYSIIKKIVQDILCSWSLSYFLVYLETKIIYKKKYDLIIGVDRIGFIESSILSKIYKIPYLLVSFEIMFESETSLKFKKIEIKATHDCRKWIIQDEERAVQLSNENKLSLTNCLQLPLASAGRGILKEIRLRDELGIPRHKKVAILIGSLASWTMTELIIKSVYLWPEEWVLIIHERYGKTNIFVDRIFNETEFDFREKIYLSCHSSNMVDDMGFVFSGVDVGLAFYKPDFKTPFTGKNLIHLGLASGKISTYLRYSIPVIINEIGLYSEKVRKHDFGNVVDTVEQIGLCLEKEDWLTKGFNASRFFEEYLDFKRFEKDILDSIIN